MFLHNKRTGPFSYFNIGIFDSSERAKQVVKEVTAKPGFCDHAKKVRIHKCVKLFAPRLLNRTFWEDGFEICK